MKKLLLIVFLFVGIRLWADVQTDSLRHRLVDADEVEKLDILNQLAAKFAKTDSTLSLNYAQQLYKLAIKLNKPVAKGKAFFAKGDCYFYFHRKDIALDNYLDALAIFKKFHYSKELDETYNSIGLTYFYLGKSDLALSNYFKALDISDSCGDFEEQAHIYSNIGMVYSYIDKYEQAISNYREALNINKKIGVSSSVAVNYNGLGVSYYTVGQLDSALVNFKQALGLFEQLNDTVNYATTLNNIANIYVDKNDSLEFAKQCFLKAYKVFDELGDSRNQSYVLDGLGESYSVSKNYSEAIQIFHKGIRIAKKIKGSYYIQQLLYKDLSASYDSIGNISSAYKYFRLFKAYQDSLHEKDRMQQVNRLEKQFEMEKKEAEIVRLNSEKAIAELQLKQDRVVRDLGVIIIFILLVATIFISFSYLDKRKRNQLLHLKNRQIEDQKAELENTNQAKNKFFSIIAHDLKNPFHSVLGFSQLLVNRYEKLTDDDRKRYATDIYKSSYSIYRLLQNLLDWSRSQTGRLNYCPATFDFVNLYHKIEILVSPLAEEKGIRLREELPAKILLTADPMMLETILRNILTNAIKFSYENSEILTRLEILSEEVLIAVKDQGMGMSEDYLKQLFRLDAKIRRRGTNMEEGTGLGLILCQEFVFKNKGRIWAESVQGQGTTFFFTIPYRKI